LFPQSWPVSKCGLNSHDTEKSPLAGFCKHGRELSGSTKCSLFPVELLLACQ
jgi:hypothetical protein